jgi:hypothetical protein
LYVQELRDLSDLRTADDEWMVVPLNGERYRVLTEPPAETVLGAMGNVGGGADLAEQLAELQKGGKLDAGTLAELQQSNPVLMMRMAAMGRSQTERSIAFLQAVLEPADARRWAENMRPPPERVPCDANDPRRLPPDPAEPEAVPVRAATDDEKRDHRRRMITLRQCMGVYQELMAVYSGRPTEPPSSSGNGHGGSGGASTGGALLGASTP